MQKTTTAQYAAFRSTPSDADGVLAIVKNGAITVENTNSKANITHTAISFMLFLIYL